MPECKADIYYSDKLSGLSIAEIARKHGVSHQAVSQAISNKYGKRRTPRFRKWTEEKCIYGNLRKWLNDNEIGITKFLIMFCKDGSYSPGKATMLHDWFSGKRNPSKSSIDRLLQITGMTYEQLFSVNESGCSSPERLEPVVYAQWVDDYGGRYANQRYRCSACKGGALWEFERDELGHMKELPALSERCPYCGAHMIEEGRRMRVKDCKGCEHCVRRKLAQYHEPKNFHPIGFSHAYAFCNLYGTRCSDVKKCGKEVLDGKKTQ